ncbi:hypothetical protein [Umezawaea tangerina]|nr:hypothetical protein [Umezawaea tangerina]
MAWLQDYVIHTGVLGIVEAVLGLLAFGALLSALLGSAAIKAGAIVTVLFVILALFILLVANKVEWRRRADVPRRVLRNYCDSLESRGQQWRTKSWVEEVDVQANGDVRQRISLSVVAECEQLDFVTLTTGPNWDWPDRNKPKVRLKVRSFEMSDEGGTRFDYMSDWLERSRLKVIVYLHEPASMGSEVSFVVDLEWPAKCVPLMRGYDPDDFVLQFGKPVEEVKCVVVLPPGFRVCFDKLGLTTADDFTLKSFPTRSGQVETTLVVHNAPANRKFGMRLDLRHEAQP